MRTIWKFPLELGGLGWQQLNAAGDGPVVLVDLDPATGQPAVWIEHDPTQIGKSPMREFRIFPTGGGIEPGAVHRGSLIDKPRHLVRHVYERVPPASRSITERWDQGAIPDGGEG